MSSKKGRPEKLSIVVFSGDFDKVHYALVMASGALATDTPVTLFLTMWACKALEKRDEAGIPGWAKMPVSQEKILGIDLDNRFRERKVATFEEMLEACTALGCKFMVCEMGLKGIGMTPDQLRDDVTIEPGGMVTFLDDAQKDGSVVFV